MIIINNVQYRNLEEQVKKNMDDIQYILEGEGLLNEFGIKIVGEITSSSQLPDPDTYQGEYGDAYAVGTASPYTLYIYTRANDTHPNNYWFNIGEFPLAGPQGPAGPKGPQGPQGTRGSTWSSGTSAPTTTSGNLAGDKYLNTTNGDVYNYTGSTWQLIGNIRGPRGIQGPQGPAGPAGFGSQTNGFYYYNAIPTATPVLGENYTYDDSKTEYPIGIEFVSGQMVMDPNGNIYEATGSIMVCRFINRCVSGIYTYNGVISENPQTGAYYGFNDSLVQYPTGCRFFDGQLIIDSKENIFKCTSSSSMCVAVFVKGSGLPTNGFYYYNAIPSSSPVLGQNYTYDDTKTEYPVGMEFVSGQMVIDPNGNIYEATGSVMICRFEKSQTTGIYTYNGVPSQNPEIGTTYSFTDSLVQYPSGCSFFTGQFIVDNNGNIYKCTASTMCMAVSVKSSTGGGSNAKTYYCGFNSEKIYAGFYIVLDSSKTPPRNISELYKCFGPETAFIPIAGRYSGRPVLYLHYDVGHRGYLYYLTTTNSVDDVEITNETINCLELPNN